MRIQAQDWGRVFLKPISDKELVSNIYKELWKLNNKKINPVKKWAKDLNGDLTKEDRHLINEYREQCSTSCFVRELQVKAIVRHRYTPIRITEIQNMTAPNVGKDWRSSWWVVGMQNVTAALEDSVIVSYDTKHTLTLPSSKTPGYLPDHGNMHRML